MKTKIFFLLIILLGFLSSYTQTKTQSFKFFRDIYLHSDKNLNIKNFSSLNFDNKQILSDNALSYLPLKRVHYVTDYNQNWVFADSSEFMYYTSNPNKGKLMYELVFFSSGIINKYYYRYSNTGLYQSYSLSDFYNNSWHVSLRDTFVYNANSKCVSMEKQHFNNLTGSFYTVYKLLNTYNFNNKLTEQVEYDNYYDMLNDTIVLYIKQRVLVAYNSANQYTSAVTQTYDTTNHTYKSSYKENYYYDNTGKLNKVYMFEWNPTLFKWDTVGKVTNISWYKWVSNNIEDLCKNLLSYQEVTQYWGSEVYFSKYIISYDPIDDEVVDDLEMDYDPYSNTWYIYDFKYLITRNSFYGNMITQKIEQYFETGQSGYENKHKWVYKQPSPTGIAENNYTSSIKLFPNPNNGTFYILCPDNFKNANITITDISGKIIMNKNLQLENHLNPINISDFEKGIYFVSIQSESFSEIFKILKE